MADCIAAISTPMASGGVSMIRISGADALEVAAKVFIPKYPVRDIEKMDGYTAAYGDITADGTKLDDGVLLIFRAPHSYTGENTAEITCHGGIHVTKRVLQAVLSAGAVMAQAGEFTKQALVNGKLSLTEAYKRRQRSASFLCESADGRCIIPQDRGAVRGDNSYYIGDSRMDRLSR